MAIDITTEIDDFQNAIYGEEVRGSLISLAEKLVDLANSNESTVNTAASNVAAAVTNLSQLVTAVTGATSDAQNAATSANNAASAANTARVAIELNETERQSAETSRANAETSRVSAESARVTAEQGRTGAETSRQSAELDRATAESSRNVAEQARASAESTRASAEAERVGRENARVANEDLRISNEQGRVNAETDRQRAFNNMAQQVLPTTSTTTLGGMIVGDGLTADANGKVDVVGAGDLETGTHAAATYATKTELSEKANSSHTHSASDVTSGTLPVTRGGTGVTSNPSMLTNLGSMSADDVLKDSPRPGVTGTLPITNGGTGLTASPSMLTDLASTAADDVLDASPRPGVTGTLPVANGGTGGATAAAARTNLGVPSSTDLDNVESSIATVEQSTATASHAKDSHFMLDGELRKATSAIASGESITNSNSTTDTLQGQIDTLQDSVGRLFIEKHSTNGNLQFQVRYPSGEILAFAYRITNDDVTVNVYTNGAWKGQKTIATWS